MQRVPDFLLKDELIRLKHGPYMCAARYTGRLPKINVMPVANNVPAVSPWSGLRPLPKLNERRLIGTY